MKKGDKFTIRIDDREFEVVWQGKSEALKWARSTQLSQLEDHRELYELRQKYPVEVAPELHNETPRHTFAEVLALLPEDSDAREWLAEQAKADAGREGEAPPGALGRQHELCMEILTPTYGQESADELFDENPVLCLQLAMEVMEAHKLDAKVPLS